MTAAMTMCPKALTLAGMTIALVILTPVCLALFALAMDSFENWMNR